MLNEGRQALWASRRLNFPKIGAVVLLGLGYGACYLLLFEIARALEAYFSVSLWYPPAGLRVAALLWFGWRFGFIAVAAEFVVYEVVGLNSAWLLNVDGGPVAVRIGEMLASAALPPFSYALAAAAMAHLPLAPPNHGGIAYVTRVCCVGATGAVLASVLTCHLIAASGLIAPTELPQAISAFWIGDVIGVLAWAPLFGVAARRWLTSRVPELPGATRIAPPLPMLNTLTSFGGGVVEAVFVCAIAALLLRTGEPHHTGKDWYPLMLPVIWSAFRYGLGGAIVSGFVVSLALASFVAIPSPHDAREMQVFMIVVSLTGLLLGAFASALREERSSLEARIHARTRALADEVERRRRAEAEAIAEKHRAEVYLNMTRAAIVACDRDGQVTMANDEACAILGRDRRNLEGLCFATGVVPPDYGQAVALWFDRLLNGADSADTFSTPIVRDDGGRVLIEWRAVPLRDPGGRRTAILLAGVDMTERARSEEETRFLATHDALTGVFNRRMLPEITADALARARRHACGMAVLFADLNNFKRVNDTFGHAVGDRVLIETANRLIARVRQTDRVIRVGGDEFVIVVEDVAQTLDSARLGIAIARAVTRPIVVEGATVRIGVAIGIACYPRHGTTPGDLLAAADAAMYARKRRRGSGIRLAG